MWSVLCLFFFSFYGSAAHRVLHSFPTRRSSDLNLLDWSESCSSVGHGGDRLGAAKPIDFGGTGATRGKKERSEEHTSELQSRVDLVCRLLLEKKKKQKRKKRKTNSEADAGAQQY